MQPNPNPQIIEGLKAAGEELKKVFPLAPVEVSTKESAKPSVFAKALVDKPESKEEINLFKKMAKCQRELSQEQAILEKSHQQIQTLEKKLAERIELLKKLQAKRIEIAKELKEFEGQLTLAKKENKGLLEKIKDSLSEQGEYINE